MWIGGKMSVREINFDGLIGPSHNYAGLSLGNLASAKNAGGTSHPRAAALQGIAKMRANLDLGLVQGLFCPPARPDRRWLEALGTAPEHADPAILACALSASAMWAANAATVSPATETADGKCHLTVANLVTMPHRSHEWQDTLAQLRLAFASPAFAVHPPIPAPFGDEGAANHMRLASSHSEAGVEIFVYGVNSIGDFPARQHIEASKAVARTHGVSRALFVRQSDQAIAAGAFHNDVVAVANEHVLFAHEHAFDDAEHVYRDLRALLPSVTIIQVPASEVPLTDAISSYLFNAQLVTLPGGAMALVLPTEAQDNPHVWGWLQTLIAGNGPIQQLIPVNVRESMANGGGPACLRLRVVCDPADVDQRFLVDGGKLDRIADVVRAHWPEAIEPEQLGDPALWHACESARAALLGALDLSVLLSV
jgi:succinylarginine dihydrolase